MVGDCLVHNQINGSDEETSSNYSDIGHDESDLPEVGGPRSLISLTQLRRIID